MIPSANASGLPQITAQDFKDNDPSTLNRVLRLIAGQLQAVQVGLPASAGITGSAPKVTATPAATTASVTPVISATASTVCRQGTHAIRLSSFLPAAQPAGSFFYETDRTSLYLNFLAATGNQVWLWVAGAFLGPYASKPADLGVTDTGFVFEDTGTYFRSWTWTGAAWTYSVGQPPYGAISMTMLNGSAPGWHLADGSTVSVSKADGTASSLTLPNLVGYFPKGGTYSGANVAATVPTISGHTSSGTAVIGNDTDTPVSVMAGVDSTVAISPHTHVDAGHTHNVTAANSPIGLPADPVPFVLIPFYIKL